MRKVVAICSGGGHWVQMMRLRPAFEGCRMTYVTVDPSCAADVPEARFRCVLDANRSGKLRLAWLACQVGWILLRERPNVVISTGAAPGYFGLRIGKLLGARTIWVDSIANVEQLSMSGRLAERCADLWLTQWPELASPQGPRYVGRVI